MILEDFQTALLEIKPTLTVPFITTCVCVCVSGTRDVRGVEKKTPDKQERKTELRAPTHCVYLCDQASGDYRRERGDYASEQQPTLLLSVSWPQRPSFRGPLGWAVALQ